MGKRMSAARIAGVSSERAQEKKAAIGWPSHHV
jgi:hypothetical protein